ncbi:MAG TPA: NAD(P)/FAD-dependent oxidoreductase [Terriglobales bacterium]|nr:NAD(P)/FAD-dependent oxidoreductase [Terriglobales bacterium]
MDQPYDAIILGAGAAGLMCAIEAGRHGQRVLLLEHQERIGKKILISGGGRCNFTNLHTRPDNFLSANPHFVKSALARYTPADFIALVEKHHIPYHEKKLGQLFCDRSAQEITGMLEQECCEAGVEIKTSTAVRDLQRDVQRTVSFVVRTDSHTFHAPCLVIATGGLSIPKMGATSLGYDLALKFGLKIQEPRPALVPLVFSESDSKRWSDLAGLSVEVVASVTGSKQTFRENMLFTHRGISGPAILQISSYWNGRDPVQVDLAPGRELVSEYHALGNRDPANWKSLLRDVMPRRLADRWLEVHPLTGVSDAALAKAERQLHQWMISPQGTEGFGKAEVTAGGVDTSELSAKTMESRKVPGLFLIGEVVDVTGQLGGFNFQWAWASGYCAGQAIAEKLLTAET